MTPLDVPCPYCAAPIGERCERGKRGQMNRPHDARLGAATVRALMQQRPTKQV